MPTPPEGEDGAGEAAPAPAVLPQTVGLHGVVVAFDPAQENWSEYVANLFHGERHGLKGKAESHLTECSRRVDLPTD